MNRGALREPSKASRASETARMCRAFSRILSVPAELFEQWKLERRCPAASGRWEARRGEARRGDLGSWHFSACLECEHPGWQLVEAEGDAGGLCEGRELSPGVGFPGGKNGATPFGSRAAEF